MNPGIWTYLGLFVAILILLWAVFEMRSRFRRRQKADAKAMRTWVTLDSGRAGEVHEEPLPLVVEEDAEAEEEEKSDLHLRAQQNGHYSPSKKV